MVNRGKQNQVKHFHFIRFHRNQFVTYVKRFVASCRHIAKAKQKEEKISSKKKKQYAFFSALLD